MMATTDRPAVAAQPTGVADSGASEREVRSPVLEVVGVSKSFGGSPALVDVGLRLPSGEVHALVGGNGSGKSTLIRVLSGYHVPDSGEVLVAGKPLETGSPASSHALGCRFVHQDLGLVDSLPVLDNLYFGSRFPTRAGTIRTRRAIQHAEANLARVGLDVDPTTAVSSLPPATRTGVAVARSLWDAEDGDVKLLVLDEPTAALSVDDVEQLLAMVAAVASSGVAVLYVTHRIEEIFRIASTAWILRDGQMVSVRKVSGMRRQELIEDIAGRELDETDTAPVDVPRKTARDVVLTVRNLVAGPLDGVSFEVSSGEVVGVAGVTGSGRETLLQAVFGATEFEDGSVTVDGHLLARNDPVSSIRVGMAFLPADRRAAGGILDLSARENLTLADLAPLWQAPTLRLGLERSETDHWFERLGIRPATGQSLPLAVFSGGNQQKVLLAKWLRRRPRVLLLDEPTQGVDVAAKADLHRELLLAAGGGASVIVSSSDTDELVAICHRVLVLRHGCIVACLSGDDISVSRITLQLLGATDGAAA